MASSLRDDQGTSCSVDAHKAPKYDPADSISEWRSWEQLEASPASTSPLWDSGDDISSGSSASRPRPSDLYGKYTWKIENFSQISKRELRSSIFEVGSYKWYILVYPQGCDVCNHLSLFLCVADYDKLLPGWSHFAQFTISVVNKDPKKSKYSDTLHHFCKKEHDWGWKKFMELSKVLDSFTVADTLVIKAQVQVIRENPHRPFRYLDSQYRRELVRVYLTNVEGICRRFLEEKREKIGKLMGDAVRWSSFRGFWLAVDVNVRRRLSRERTETILKAIVKCFFNEKEVTSTLVMDALYSGCKALGYPSKSGKGQSNGMKVETETSPIVWVDKEFFVLAGDILLLLERAANTSLSFYRDDKGPQNRTKDVGSGDEFGKGCVERDEQRLTELGSRMVEMFVLAHLFSNRVEVAYLEAIALKRQEELIREEEAAGQAEMELKARREASEKEKRTKKKQRRNSRKEKEKEKEREKVKEREKGKDKGKGRGEQEKVYVGIQEPLSMVESDTGKIPRKSLLKGSSTTHVHTGDDDDDSSVLDSVDGVVGTLRPAVDDGDADTNLWEREEMHQVMEAGFSGNLCMDPAQNGHSSLNCDNLLDDSSSTCSSDSIPCRNGVSNGLSRRRMTLTGSSSSLVNRRHGRAAFESSVKDLKLDEANGMIQARKRINEMAEATSTSTMGGLDTETVIVSLKQQVQWLQQRLQEKEEEVVALSQQLSLYQHHYGNIIVEHEDGTYEPVEVHPKLVNLDVNSTECTSKKMDFKNKEAGQVATMDASACENSWANKDADTAEQPRCIVTESESEINEMLTSTPGAHIVDSCTPQEEICVSKPMTSSAHAGSGPLVVDPPSSNSCISPSSPAQTGFSRPSSAPGLATTPVMGSSMVSQQQLQPQTLARSASSIEQLSSPATEPVSASQNVSVPSYRNTASGPVSVSTTVSPCFSRSHGAAIDVIHSSSAFPNGGHCYSLLGYPSTITQVTNGTLRVAFDETMLQTFGQQVCGEGLIREDIIEDNSIQLLENGHQQRTGLTFGTVTPEMIHAQQQQQHQLQHPEFELMHTGYHNFEKLQEVGRGRDYLQLSQANLVSGPQNNITILQRRVPTVQQSSQMRPETANVALVSEEFPHLDIINELLDEDKVLSARALRALLQQPGNDSLEHQLSIHDIQRMCARQLCASMYGNGPEINVLMHCDDGNTQGPSPMDHRQNNLRDGVHVVYPYVNSMQAGSFSRHGSSIDGMPGHDWPSVHANLRDSTCTNVPSNGLEFPVGFPMQNPHMPIADCSPYNQSGFAMYQLINHH